ncbi:MAG: hypothetical protein ABIK99_01975 [candidate division WOR-3 bacterium]
MKFFLLFLLFITFFYFLGKIFLRKPKPTPSAKERTRLESVPKIEKPLLETIVPTPETEKFAPRKESIVYPEIGLAPKQEESGRGAKTFPSEKKPEIISKEESKLDTIPFKAERESRENILLEEVPSTFSETLFPFPWELRKRETILERVDYNLGWVFFDRYLDTIYLGTVKVMTISEYLAYKMTKDLRSGLMQEGETKRIQERGRVGVAGLIPEIEIPKVPLIGESRINISGDNRITIGGRSTVLSGATETGRRTPLFPELKMEQILNLNLQGSIGERTKIFIDHSSQRELEAKNKVKLEYTGGEDDIIQKVELGETQLSIPRTAFTGDIPTRKGLFGVSSQAKVGGIDLWAIASREQSQPQTKEFKGKASFYADTIYDYDFVKGRFFLLGDSVGIKELYLYYDDNQPYGTGKIRAIATINPENPEDTLPNPDFRNDYRKGSFTLLEGNKDYRLHTFREGEVILEMLRDVSGGWLACTYITGNDDTVGGYRFQDSLIVLKLLKAFRYTPQSKTWDLTLRNIYQLRESKVKLEEVKIFRDEPDIDIEGEPRTGKTFLQITGLDPDGDGQIGYPQFLPTLGLLVFPYPKPFALSELSVRDTVIYTTDVLQPGQGGKYYILVKYTTLTKTISIGPDVEEGTVKVYVNGTEQEPGVDYRVDYEKGEITFLKPLPPDAEIKVTYEYLPLFMAVSRSVLGLRAEGKFLENGKIGTSLFYRSEMSPQERPTLGSEPFQRMIWEGDLSYSYKNEGFTDFLNRLPLVRAQAPTEVSFSGEIATSLPNPNTFGVAYVDDFEGVVISEKIDLNAVNWFFASVPVDMDTAKFAKNPLLWTNRRIRKDSIFGPRVKEEREEMVDFLRVIFQPDNSSSWAGFMTGIRGGVDIRNLEYLEGIFRSSSGLGKLKIAIATTVEEDIPRRTKDGRIVGYNNYFDTEDRNRNGILDVLLGEDSGLDTVSGVDGQGIPGDDGNDDYDPNYNPQGTEGNRRLDSEDIDGNGYSPRGDNHYYEYEISLSDTIYFTSLVNNWRIFRIPLRQWTKKVGSPQDQDIRVVRLVFTDFAKGETIDFYQLELTGNKWRGFKIEGPIRGRQPNNEGPGWDTLGPEISPDTQEVIKVYQISVENDTSYNSPFELKRDAFGKKEKEASLALFFQNLRVQGRIIVPQVFYAKEDWRDYKKLKIYLHKDPNINPVFFIRMGQDSNNYYEFRSFIDRGRRVPGTDGLWYEFEISFDTLQLVRSGEIKGDYNFFGNPTLAEVKYIALGVENPYPERISGCIWFDDIRLVSPYAERGLGYQSYFRFSLSDLANFSLSLSYLDPNFVRLSEGGGVKTGNYTFNQGYSFNANLDRFLPPSWQVSLPLTYSRNVSSLIPKFHPVSPDRRLTKESPAAESAKGKGFSESWGTSIRKGKSGNKFLNYTLEALSFVWSRSKSFSQQMLSTDTSFRTSSGINYAISPNLTFELGKTEISFFPQNISFGIGYASSRTRRETKIPRLEGKVDTLRDSSRTKNGAFSFSTGYSPIEDLNFEYSENQGRDFYGVSEEGKTKRFGLETDRERNFGVSYSLELWDILNPNFDYNGGYNESRMRKRDTILTRRTFDNEGEFRIDTDLNLSELFNKLLGEEGKSGSSRSETTGREKEGFFRKFASFFKRLEPFDLSYSIGRSSEFPSAYSSPPLLYQLGFIDQFKAGETLKTPLNREIDNRFSLSSKLNLGDLGINYSYENSRERSYTSGTGQGSYGVIWPSLSITLSKVERFLKKWATSSNLSFGYQKSRDKSGQLLPSGKLSERGLRLGERNSFSPLIGWQTTWKKRINTNFNLNYSLTADNVYLTGPENISRTETKEGGFDFSISHAFSAPRGIKILFLPKIKLTQEMTLSWDVRYSRRKSEKVEVGIRTPIGSDENISTRLSASYRVSSALDAGANIGYSSFHNLVTRLRSQSVEINFWILFRF